MDLLILYLLIKLEGLLDRLSSSARDSATLQWLLLLGMFNHSLIDRPWNADHPHLSIVLLLSG